MKKVNNFILNKKIQKDKTENDLKPSKYYENENSVNKLTLTTSKK